MIWLGVWTVLVLGALLAWGLALRGLWHATRDLFHTLGEAADRIAEVRDRIPPLALSRPDPEPSIFGSPAALRQERARGASRRRRNR